MSYFDHQTNTMDQGYQGDGDLLLMPDGLDFQWPLIEDDWVSSQSFPFQDTVPPIEASNWNPPSSASYQESGLGLDSGSGSFHDVSNDSECIPQLSAPVIPSWNNSMLATPTWNPQSNLVDGDQMASGSWPIQTSTTVTNGSPLGDYSIQEAEALPQQYFGNLPAPLDYPSTGEEIIGTVTTKKNELSVEPQSTTKALKVTKSKKPRLRCPRPGCKSTFPRKYELDRHERAIHERALLIPCFVYGCNRISNPFPRLDKFHEHLRKHDIRAPQLVCIVDGCTDGPFDFEDLCSHLQSAHDLAKCTQRNFNALLGLMKLRRTSIYNRPMILEDSTNCPLAFLGCAFKSPDKKFYPHLKIHQFSERSLGYEAIISVQGHWGSWGLTLCPICKRTNPDEFDRYFIQHIWSHTEAERLAVATELAGMFRPYLTGKESDYIWDDGIGEKIRAELEAAGAIPPRNP